MTEEKRLTAAELFAKYDEDGSNSIDADELDLMLKECGHKPDKETAKLLLSEHVDGMEEELSFEQFSALLRVLDTRALFDKYDADGSGTIDEGELQTMLESCGHATDAGGAKGLLDEFSEGKGELTKLQFANVLKKLDVDDASRRGIIGDPAADGVAFAGRGRPLAETPPNQGVWAMDVVNVSITARARLVSAAAWPRGQASVVEPPVSPVPAADLVGPVVEVTLLPYGATDLRITEIPTTDPSDGAAPAPPREGGF